LSALDPGASYIFRKISDFPSLISLPSFGRANALLDGMLKLRTASWRSTLKTKHSHRIYAPNQFKHLMRSRHARRFSLAVFASLVLVTFCVAQRGGSQPSAITSLVPAPAHISKTIYVSDFDLDARNFKQDKGGVTGKGYLVPAPPKNLPSLRRKRKDSATESSQLVQLMSESLVADLLKAGFTARRLLPSDARPGDGLLVSGEITALDEGNQMRRALFGFGSGKAKMELRVTMADISSTDLHLYDTLEQKRSGRAPGAAIALNPYLGAASFVAKFAMTKNAPEKMVKKTASQIAMELTRQLNTDSLANSDRATDDHLGSAASLDHFKF
jgi:hypothetical protein